MEACVCFSLVLYSKESDLAHEKGQTFALASVLYLIGRSLVQIGADHAQ